MRQLAVYLTRVQPAKLNITWGVTRLRPSSLLLARVGSHIFLERVAESTWRRVASCHRTLALPCSITHSVSYTFIHS